MGFESEVLALLPKRIESVLSLRLLNYDNIEIETAKNRKATSFANVKGDIALIGIYGYISQKPSIWTYLGFETSSEDIGRQIDSAIADKSIGAIVIDVDSPGGTVVGLTAISDKIYEARNIKPIVAISNSLMASAAYFIGSAASEIVATADSQTGCIGSIGVVQTAAKFFADNGIENTVFRSEQFKGEGNPYEPLTEEAKAYFQKTVDEYGNIFVEAVARNRGKTKSDIKQNFGQGRTFNAKEAKAVGMIDRIGTLEQVINEMTGNANKNTNKTSRNQAQLDLLKMKNRIGGSHLV